MNRTDIHRPSAIVPSDYDFVAFEYLKLDSLGACDALMRERAKIEAHMARTGGTYSSHEHGGNCMVCGNVFATYTVLFYHRPSNVYVRLGQDCAMKLEMSNDGAYNRFTAAVRDAREAQAGKRKAEATLNDAGLSSAWALYNAQWSESFRNDETIARDIVSKLVKYGSLSEKQVAFLRSLMERIERRPQIEAQRAAEAAAAPAWVAGRQVVTGEIVSAKWQENDFAYGAEASLKALIKLADGRKLWTTLPRVFYDTQSDCATWARGKQITINVTVQPKDGDHSFAFGKRPTLQSPVPPTEAK